MSPVTQTVTIPTSTNPISGYLAVPSGEGKFPGVIVIHEVYGLNDDIKSIAERFADASYIALAVDLFAGRNRIVCMFRLLTAMFTNPLYHGGIHDLKSALTHLETMPKVDSNRIGAIGFCMGGNFSICWACTDERLRVVAPFYGVAPRPIGSLERSCPVVGSYPENDFTAGAGRKIDTELDKYNIPHDIKIYPNAKHSFFNQGRNHDETAAQDSWQRVLAFFKEHLG